MRRTLRERFEEKYEPCPITGCWLWKAADNGRGYGLICAGGHSGPMLYAHRVAYELANGPIPDGLCVCHRCDNGPIGCVNPDHLFLASQAENLADMAQKGRGSRSSSGLPYGVVRQVKTGRFGSQVQAHGEPFWFGTFDTIEEAHAAAIAGRNALWGTP